MFINDFKLFMCFIELLVRILCGVKASVRISVTAPVNPVKEGTFFAVHCQVWDLNADHRVIISREINGRSIVLFWGDQPAEVGQREYLAVRTLSDGSIVYFLSVTDITQSDKGNYSCKIMGTSGSVSEIAVKTVFIDIMHFPNDGNPLCGASEGTTVLAGSRVTFNCTSEDGVPQIATRWLRMGHNTILDGHETRLSSRVTNTLTMTANRKDDGVVYLCQITSPAFPTLIKSCHIGPIRVLPGYTTDGDAEDDKKEAEEDTYVGNRTPNVKDSVQMIPKDVFVKGNIKLNKECLDTCTLMKSSASRWVIATIIASAFALIFVVVGIALLLRYYHLTTFDNHNGDDGTGYTQQVCIPREQLYSELDRKRGDYRVYMALERKVDNQIGFSDTQ
ncbi:cell adhesion molecule 1-like [Amphiura filiformis]|uniref:cell adhesion molecule 1-like n=1 Tax=Amphiura filiformis TaxID=82378 RepID=UPI003B21FAB6